MADLWHQMGGGLQTSASGSLLLVSGPLQTQQRVIRRLLTNPGDYIWQPGYGAGLGRYVGLPVDPGEIQAVVLAQLVEEAGVSQSPPPVVVLTMNADGSVNLALSYTDSSDGTLIDLDFPL